MGIKITCTGEYKKTRQFLNRLLKLDYSDILTHYGRKGVEALKQATPKDTGKTADSWYYEIDQGRDRATINWCNNNENKGINIALILQYGHGTANGAYIQGIDYVNPAIQPIFRELANDCWKEVTKS